MPPTQPPTCSPYCTVPNIKEDIEELKGSMTEMHNKQDKLIELNANINNLKEMLDKLEKRDIREKENIFKRVGALEINTISKKDLSLALTALGVIFTVLNIGINVLLKVLKVI